MLHIIFLGAGLGTFLTFATFMRRSQGAVKLGSMTPFFNNVVSMMCGILVFSTVFSVQRQEGDQVEDIVGTLRFNGPGNTGLTFIWYLNLPNPLITIVKKLAIAFKASEQDPTTNSSNEGRESPKNT